MHCPICGLPFTELLGVEGSAWMVDVIHVRNRKFHSDCWQFLKDSNVDISECMNHIGKTGRIRNIVYPDEVLKIEEKLALLATSEPQESSFRVTDDFRDIVDSDGEEDFDENFLFPPSCNDEHGNYIIAAFEDWIVPVEESASEMYTESERTSNDGSTKPQSEASDMSAVSDVSHFSDVDMTEKVQFFREDFQPHAESLSWMFYPPGRNTCIVSCPTSIESMIDLAASGDKTVVVIDKKQIILFDTIGIDFTRIDTDEGGAVGIDGISMIKSEAGKHPKHKNYCFTWKQALEAFDAQENITFPLRMMDGELFCRIPGELVALDQQHELSDEVKVDGKLRLVITPCYVEKNNMFCCVYVDRR